MSGYLNNIDSRYVLASGAAVSGRGRFRYRSAASPTAVGPHAMKSGGYYAENSSCQQTDVMRGLSTVRDAGRRAVTETATRMPVIVDYGCADGGNSMMLTDEALSGIRDVAADSPCTIIRNDRFDNDFNQIARRMATCQDMQSNIFEQMCAGSFYSRLLPDESVSLAISFSAAHWLSGLPPELRQTEYISFEHLSATQLAYAAELAHADWMTFLQHRSCELQQGGRLVVSMVGRGEKDDGVHAPFRLLQDAIDILTEEGVIPDAIRTELCLPIYRRNLEEVMVPFVYQCESSVSLQLEVEATSETEVDCPLFAQFEQDNDVYAYANRYVNFIRAFSESVVNSVMPREANIDRLTDAIYTCMTELVSAHPLRYRLTRSQILVVARKR